MAEPSERYAELAARVDAFHARVEARYPGALTCRRGCSLCCHQHLTVLGTEFRRIAAAVDALDEAARDALRARLRAGRADPRCPLLDDAGACRVYAARPMICRSHGLPIQVGDPPRRDVCPLNFPDGPAVDALDADAVLDVERLNVILGLLDRVEGGGDGSRVDLLDGLALLLDVSAP